jgi:hypothetical protein
MRHHDAMLDCVQALGRGIAEEKADQERLEALRLRRRETEALRYGYDRTPPVEQPPPPTRSTDRTQSTSPKTNTAPTRHQETSMKTQTDHNMRARLERLETAQERRELLASRPDLTANAKTKAWLESAPIVDVRAACDTLARTDVHTSAPVVSAADRERIRSRMRGGSQSANPSGRATRMNGTNQEFLDLTPEQARARLAEMDHARAGSSKRRSA